LQHCQPHSHAHAQCRSGRAASFFWSCLRSVAAPCHPHKVGPQRVGYCGYPQLHRSLRAQPHAPSAAYAHIGHSPWPGRPAGPFCPSLRI
ncbi:hypothetical protein GGI06_002664, partial [Coemansia sp. S85]